MKSTPLAFLSLPRPKLREGRKRSGTLRNKKLDSKIVMIYYYFGMIHNYINADRGQHIGITV